MIQKLLLNYYALTAYILFISILIYLELRRPWGYLLPIAAAMALFLLLPNLSSIPMRFVIAYGGFGILLCLSEWLARGHQRR